ncbi:MAG: TIGR03905 family TSCPD domain-containing protein [Ruthenibacterium lactatiformans]
MTYTRKNKGVCSLSTEVTLTDDGVIESVTVVGGCNGNLKGISALLTGLRAEDAIRRLKGLTCGSKHTSCPDQIALALEEALANEPSIRYQEHQNTGRAAVFLACGKAGKRPCGPGRATAFAQKRRGTGVPGRAKNTGPAACFHPLQPYFPVKERSDG